MKTQIFADVYDFYDRPDKTVNGVTQTFADANPGWDAERGNQACWNCSGCSGCSDCSRCSRCSDCSDCSRCSRCSGCSGEIDAVKKVGKAAPSSVIPTIPNIHQAVLAAVTATPDAFDMSDWHTCETTHCRGGWVVELAGQAGKALEAFHNTELAAYLIYKASSPSIPVPFTRFYENNETAMEDIKRCAALEAAQTS